jgi:hypothetical protein
MAASALQPRGQHGLERSRAVQECRGSSATQLSRRGYATGHRGRALWIMRALVLIVLLAACGSEHTATGDPVAQSCAARNTYPRFAHCPHWRMAMPSACGSSVQPSFMDPCACMCDLCETDADCDGGKCLSILSTMYGDPRQKSCVHKGEPCWPDGKCPGKQECRNYNGTPDCETIEPERDR